MLIDDCILVQALRVPEWMVTLDDAQWDLLIRQARTANLLARLWHFLKSRDLLAQVPPHPRRHLEWANMSAQRHDVAVRAEVSAIRKALQEFRIILLKGAAYTMTGLPAAAGRIFSDIDIMVPKAMLVDAESALMAHGWVATHHDAYDQRYYREWMHELPPLQHIRREASIDVHHAILPQTMAVHPDPAKLQAAAMPVNGDDMLCVLAPADMVLHSAAHLFYEGELPQGLRDLTDLSALLHLFSAEAGFWDGLVARAVELQLTRSLFYAMRYLERVLAFPIPPNTLAAASVGRPPASTLRLMDAIYLRALLPDHASCRDRHTGMARTALYLRATWLRMPPLLLARHLFHKAFISKRSAR